METGLDELAFGSDSPKSRVRTIIVFVARLFVATVVLYFVLRLVSLDRVILALRTASIPYILIGACLLTVNIASRVMKWRYMLRIVKAEIGWWESFTSIMLGITFGSFTPAQLGELGGRSMRIAHSKSSHVVGLTLVDRTQVFLVVAMAGTFSYPFFITDNAFLATAIGTVCAAICLYFYFRLDLVKRVADKINLKIFRHHWIDGIIESFTFIGRDHFLSTLAFSLVFFAVIVLQMYFILNAFAQITLWHVFLGFSAMMFFKALLNISISELGIREASTIYFFSMFGIPDATSLSASVVMFAINMIIPSLIGILFLPNVRRKPFSGSGRTSHD